MKNVMIVDGAENCVYDVFETTDDVFALLFPSGTDIAFIEDVERREHSPELATILNGLWSRRVPKAQVRGIHGILFYGLPQKRQYYPTLRDEEAVNPDGSRLR